MRGMKKLILISLLLSVFLLSGCMIHFNFNNNDTSKSEIQSESTQDSNTTIENMTINIPTRFEEKAENSYYDSNSQESLNIYVSERYFDSIEKEVEDIFNYVDASNVNTTYEKLNGYDVAITEWDGYNKNGWKLKHRTYDFFVDNKIYEITFANAEGNYSDKEIINTISFN